MFRWLRIKKEDNSINIKDTLTIDKITINNEVYMLPEPQTFDISEDNEQIMYKIIVYLTKTFLNKREENIEKENTYKLNTNKEKKRLEAELFFL